VKTTKQPIGNWTSWAHMSKKKFLGFKDPSANDLQKPQEVDFLRTQKEVPAHALFLGCTIIV